MSEILKTTANVNNHKDLVVRLKLPLGLTEGTAGFSLRYVPDKRLLEHGSVCEYIHDQIKSAEDWENLIHIIQEDLINAIVPRWIEVGLWQHTNQQEIQFSLQDKQPHWQNDFLLNNLSPLI